MEKSEPEWKETALNTHNSRINEPTQAQILKDTPSVHEEAHHLDQNYALLTFSGFNNFWTNFRKKKKQGIVLVRGSVRLESSRAGLAGKNVPKRLALSLREATILPSKWNRGKED